MRPEFEVLFWETFEEIFGRHVGRTMRAILALRELFGAQARTVEQQVLSRLWAR